MHNKLEVTVGSYSDKGLKEINQDFHEVCIPSEPQLSNKGIAIAIADGISSSEVSQIASKTAVTSFLLDYFSTPDYWSVKKSAQRVINSINSWLYAKSSKGAFHYDKNRGYVCTFSAMVIRSTTAYLFHLGDARIYRLRDDKLEQLTDDHRVWISSQKSYLGRALGIDTELKIDFDTQQVEPNDIYLFMTDGVYEYVGKKLLISVLQKNHEDFNKAAKIIVEHAYEAGSADNLTIQLLRIDKLPDHNIREVKKQLLLKPLPPILEERMHFDGYEIIRELSGSSRSHVYLAVDSETESLVVLKTPSIDLQNDKAYLERFLMEEWIARRLNSAHLVKSYRQTRKRNYLYNVTEFIEGQTLTQWMIDNPKPSLEEVRAIIEQIAKGLYALHKQEMIHQDIRPDNIMIDNKGTIKIIDFGSTRVDGIVDINSAIEEESMLGTLQYSAPEYFLGDLGSTRSDLFSLAVVAYQMLSGKLPYGTQVAKSTTKAAQRKLRYRYLDPKELNIPRWIDETLKKALEPFPHNRYSELSEFIYDLRHPNETYLHKTKPPLLEHNPVVFWQATTFIFGVVIIILLIKG